jgi:hypothetical protein
LEHWKTGGLVVVLPRRGDGVSQVIRVHGYVFYVWRPALDRLWKGKPPRESKVGRPKMLTQEQIERGRKIVRGVCKDLGRAPEAKELARELDQDEDEALHGLSDDMLLRDFINPVLEEAEFSAYAK